LIFENFRHIFLNECLDSCKLEFLIMKLTRLSVLFGVLLLCAAAPLGAATLPFRSGKILAAELSTSKPEIANEDSLAFPLPFARRIYAEMVVKAAPGRGLSIHDYSLLAYGRGYPCIALRSGDAGYDARVWEVKRADPNRKYTLLFVLDATLVGLGPKEILVLRSLYPPKSRADVPVPFKNLGESGFPSPDSIPDDGIMEKAGEK